jgi:hypothetical protein
VIPLALQAAVEAQEWEGGEDVLVAVDRVGVDVMGDMVVVGPHERGAADEIVGKAEPIVDQRPRGQAAVVGAVVERHANVRPDQAQQRARQHRVDVQVKQVRRHRHYHVHSNVHAQPAPLRPALEHLGPHAIADPAIQRRVVREGARLHRDRALVRARQLLQHLLCHVVPHVVRLEQAGRVPPDRLHQHRATPRVPVQKIGYIVRHAPDHRHRPRRAARCA